MKMRREDFQNWVNHLFKVQWQRAYKPMSKMLEFHLNIYAEETNLNF
jgi:hypothetical protein